MTITTGNTLTSEGYAQLLAAIGDLAGSTPVPGPFMDVTLSQFILENDGRLPRLGDDPAPWSYRGWLLNYIEQTERWQYYLATIAEGRLLAAPIPRIDFDSAGERTAGHKEVIKWDRIVEREDHSWHSFSRLIDWFGYALGIDHTPPDLKPETLEQLYRQVDLTEWMTRPADYLGEYLAASGTKNRNGFYPTPHCVCEMMVQMTMMDDGDLRLKTVCDPAVGTGRMLLHASNRSLRLFGQDIDPMVAKICKVNAALFAPWMAFPMPARILGVTQPDPPPAPLPLPAEHQPTADQVPLRIDDRGQGLLFSGTVESELPVKPKRRKRAD